MVAPGTYRERVIIEPKDEISFELTIRSEVPHGAIVTADPLGNLWIPELDEELGIFTIRIGFDDGDDRLDMRVTIDGFYVVRRYQPDPTFLYGKGIDISVSYNDPRTT